MSTEEQDYSTLNQSEAIAAYAAAHSIEVVQSFFDDARSGLTLDRRPSLKALLNDVQTGAANFDVILVYDVSRWGRFQDADEAAYYEYLCKKSGVPLIYCAEDFENDGSLISTLAKALQRAEAADYSRRLSRKVFAGQSTLVRRGFWQGSPAGYGLRRLLLDADGSPRAILAAGERKYIQSDRVILKPGPPDEVAIVRRIFESFAHDGKREFQISRELNAEGHRNQFGRKWHPSTISKMLSNEKYAGHNVYNRTSEKMRGKSIKNPPDSWIRSNNAFDAVVDANLFTAVQRKRSEIADWSSNQGMLANLSSLLASHRHLSSTVITDAGGLHRPETYRLRFGSLMKAYQLIGYVPKNNSSRDTKRETSLKRREVLSEIKAQLETHDLAIRFNFNTRKFALKNGLTFEVYVLRCLTSRDGTKHWDLRQRRKSATDIVVGVRMEIGCNRIHDYALLQSTALLKHRYGTSVNVESAGAICFESICDLTQALADYSGVPPAR